MSSGSPTVEVPDVVGLDSREAVGVIYDAGLTWAGFEVQESSEVTGTVIATDPPSGPGVQPGSDVTLIVSGGSVGESGGFTNPY